MNERLLLNMLVSEFSTLFKQRRLPTDIIKFIFEFILDPCFHIDKLLFKNYELYSIISNTLLKRRRFCSRNQKKKQTNVVCITDNKHVEFFQVINPFVSNIKYIPKKYLINDLSQNRILIEIFFRKNSQKSIIIHGRNIIMILCTKYIFDIDHDILKFCLNNEWIEIFFKTIEKKTVDHWNTILDYKFSGCFQSIKDKSTLLIKDENIITTICKVFLWDFFFWEHIFEHNPCIYEWKEVVHPLMT